MTVNLKFDSNAAHAAGDHRPAPVAMRELDISYATSKHEEGTDYWYMYGCDGVDVLPDYITIQEER